MRHLNSIIFLFLAVPIIFAASTFPKPVGFVNDFANILPDRAEYEQGLIDYEKNTTIEVAVVTLDSLPADQILATYAVELFQEWGIGKKGEDNGLLILMVTNGTVGNRLRIEVGYGLQGYITGAEAGRILDDALPYYQKGDYQGALDTILYELPDQLTDYVPGQPARGNSIETWNLVISNLPIIIFFAIIIISMLLSNRCPYCHGKLKCSGDYCTCTKCGRKIPRKKRYAPLLIAGGFSGGGGGGGGFGGGGSGGGGAGR